MPSRPSLRSVHSVMTHSVAVLALDGVVAFDLGVPPQVFNSARRADQVPLYAVTVCTPDGGAVRSTAGFSIAPDHDLSALAGAGTVIIPGVGAGSTVTDGTVLPEVAAALRAAHAGGPRSGSSCTGA